MCKNKEKMEILDKERDRN
jgi:hypothetical protein